jgi:hypothetical protein
MDCAQVAPGGASGGYVPNLVMQRGRFLEFFDGARLIPATCSRLELEWWIVHRERAEHAPDDLAHS